MVFRRIDIEGRRKVEWKHVFLLLFNQLIEFILGVPNDRVHRSYLFTGRFEVFNHLILNI